MSNGIIQADYEILEQVVAQFGEQASAQIALRGRALNSLTGLRDSGWVGTAANSFFTEMDRIVLPATDRLHNALSEAQSASLTIAQILRAAEEEAVAQFRDVPTGAMVFGEQAMGVMGQGSINANVMPVVSAISNTLKGIAAHTILPMRYVLWSMTPNAARGKTTVAALMDMLAGKPGRGIPLIRFDGAHGGSPTPHINLTPSLTGFRDPHTPISPRLLNMLGKGSRILEGAQKIALPVAIAVDVFRIGDAFHSDGNQIGQQTKQTIGSVAGGWAGAFAGAEAGAIGGAWLGGALGSPFLGLGASVGAGVGGFLGGLIGGISGGIGGANLGEMLGGLF